MSIERMTTITVRGRRSQSAVLLLALLLVGFGPSDRSPARSDARPVAFRSMNAEGAPGAQKKIGGPLIDHGGLVLDSSTTYAIYWGTPADFPGDLESGMADLLSGLSDSSYLDIATQYMRGGAVSTTYGGSFSDTSRPPRKAPRVTDLAAEVCNLFPSPDPAGVYFVFTSNAPHVNYCAWHAFATCNGVTFQVAYVPNQALLPACSPFTKVDLGCNSYSDGTVTSADSVAHEFMEAITDAHFDAWYDKNGGEVADKCNYDYQACVELSTGSWQIQSEWSNAIGGCQQQ
jgi:hypothetical protein